MNDNDAEIRRLLDDVAAGRLSVSDAEWQIKNLVPKPTPGEAAVALLRDRLPRRQNKRLPWPAALLMAAIGTVFLGVGYYTGRKTFDFRANGATTEGVVVRMIRKDKSSKPEVKYAVNGIEYYVTGEINSSPPAFHVGEHVEILYKPDKPDDAVINSFSERWLFPIIFGGIGVLVGLAGWGILLVKILSKLFASRSSRDDERFTVEQ